MNTEWALVELESYLKVLSYTRSKGDFGYSYKMTHNRAKIDAASQVAEKVLDRVVPEWREHITEKPHITKPPWTVWRSWSARAVAELQRQDEIKENLGMAAPAIRTDRLHEWVWSAAGPLWEAGAHREAVLAAARMINVKSRQKLGRKDASEWRLLENAFSIKPPVEGEPRLRLSEDDGGESFKSLHMGVGALSRGLYMAVRNTSEHEGEGDLEEYLAVEQLAAFSMLARYVDSATVEPEA